MPNLFEHLFLFLFSYVWRMPYMKWFFARKTMNAFPISHFPPSDSTHRGKCGAFFEMPLRIWRMPLSPLSHQPFYILYTVKWYKRYHNGRSIRIFPVPRIAAVGAFLPHLQTTGSGKHHIHYPDISSDRGDPLPHSGICRDP